MNIQLKILIRFSYLSTAGFSSAKRGLEAVTGMLYDPARLERRFALFETILLPSLAAQTSTDMQVGFLTGETLPNDARRRLEILLAPYPWAQIIDLPIMEQYPAIKAAFAAMPTDPDATHVATMRTDDDDAMHVTIVERTRQLAHQIGAIRLSAEPFVIGFNRGLFMYLGERQPHYSEVSVRAPLGIGLTMVAPVDHPANIYRRNHRALPQFFDCYTEAHCPMYVRTVHQDNDSGDHPDPGKPMRPQRLDPLLRDGFGLDPDRLAQLG
ncbi:glycosyltransferase [Thalassococcus sp. S3]|uniref:glycosyltransferase n=1 Tax=Thalassococcus sp. S3 TaxID=2017482 RepID=UPI0010240232|nr:glycosyltransferase [Thalassococcus sp. S3]QBF30096.1 hypothetical protein CFI11_02535 [Thalassococcus sp. S3]